MNVLSLNQGPQPCFIQRNDIKLPENILPETEPAAVSSRFNIDGYLHIIIDAGCNKFSEFKIEGGQVHITGSVEVVDVDIINGWNKDGGFDNNQSFLACRIQVDHTEIRRFALLHH